MGRYARGRWTRATATVVAGIAGWGGVGGSGHGPASAQVVLDGSLGPARTLAPGKLTVSDADGRRVGKNLFHSFRTLNLAPGEELSFTGPVDVSRVWARVTGGSPSTIAGTLRCTIPNADFFLMNPAGVIFTATAKIDVQGVFCVTTADRITLKDGAVFAAAPDPATDALLTTAAPAAFGFLGPAAPAAVRVDKSGADRASGGTRLHADVARPPKQISIIAGRITIVGADTVTNPTSSDLRPASVDLMALGSGGELVFDPSDPVSEPAGLDTFANLADVELAARTRIEVGSTGAAPGQAGHITIRAANLFLRDASLRVRSNTVVPRGISVDARDRVELSGDSSIRTSTGDDIVTAPQNTAAAGPIHIRAGSLDVSGGQIRTQVANGAPAAGGDIDITVGGLHLAPGSTGRGEIAASNYGKEQTGGEVRITSTTPIVLDEAAAQLSRIFTDAGDQSAGAGHGGGPDAGAVHIDAPAAESLDGGAVFSVAYGNASAGAVLLNGITQALPPSAVTFDGTLGHAAGPVGRLGLLPPGAAGGAFIIGADDGVVAGGNLFYSFGQLNLNRQETLTFTGRTGDPVSGEPVVRLRNVIARVTGGAASVVDGLLRCEPANVNLFILNPAGIVVGSFARLDLHGSLALTSASALRFGGGGGGGGGGDMGGTFAARGSPFGPASAPAGRVTGFEFSAGVPAGTIDVRGLPVTSNRPEKEISRLAVAPNCVFTLVGGGVNIASRTLAAPGDFQAIFEAFPGIEYIVPPVDLAAGRVNVGAVASGDAFVACDPASRDDPLTITSGRTAAQLGSVTLSDKGTIDASGALSDARRNGAGGRIDIRSGDVSMTGGARVLAQSTMDYRAAVGHGIEIRADDDVAIRESLVFTSATKASSAGSVTVAGRNVEISGSGGDPGRGFELDDMGVAAETTGAGRGGDLTVIARDAFTLRFGGAVRSVTNGTGDGGNVSIQALNALIDNGTSTEFTVVAAQTSEILQGGAGGAVDIGTDGRMQTLELRNGASVVATTLGSGAGGRITLQATKSITLDGRDSPAANGGVEGPRVTSVDASSRPFSKEDAEDPSVESKDKPSLPHGNAGQITISTGGSLNVIGYAQIVASTQTSGAGGGIDITARRVDVGGGRYFTTQLGSAPTLFDPGIFAQAGRDTGLEDGTQTIDLTGQTIGNSGTIHMRVYNNMTLRGAGRIGTSTSNEGNAGEIKLQIGGTLLMEGRAGDAPESFAAIQSRTGNGDDGLPAKGSGGSVLITADNLVMRDGAEITTESEFNDFGGKIGFDVGDLGGSSGTLQIQLRDTLSLGRGTTIRNSSDRTNAGPVRVSAEHHIRMLSGALLTTSAYGEGGGMFVDTLVLSMRGSTINADAEQGHAGRIEINATIVQTNGSVISAVSQTFGPAEIALTPTPEIEDIGSVVALPPVVPGLEPELPPFCAMGIDLPVSTFNQPGRGGAPAQPGAWKAYLPLSQEEEKR